MRTHALIIPAINTRPVEWRSVGGLDDLQDAVGGHIEMITLEDEIVVFINEEGKLHGLPYNKRATRLLAHLLMDPDYIVGNAIVCGFDPMDGENTDLPTNFEERIT